MGDLFTFDGVTLEFDGVAALREITARLPIGELSVVAGPSGSGKSSLLRLCNRLEVPTGGSVRFRDTDLNALDPLGLRRRVGMVFQRPSVFPGTVRDNLLVARADAAETELAAMLAQAELGSTFLDRTGDDLSGGEAQRVCLARALICKPEVLLMDEPTASLHPAATLALEKTVRSLHREQGVDVIWVTHDLGQIERLAEHLLVLGNGAVLYQGDPSTQQALRSLEPLSGDGEG
jgi:ABC-type proline/glycine betaine transport system ATPase subunit